MYFSDSHPSITIAKSTVSVNNKLYGTLGVGRLKKHLINYQIMK